MFSEQSLVMGTLGGVWTLILAGKIGSLVYESWGLGM